MDKLIVQDDGEDFESLQPMAGSDDEGQSDDESHSKLMRAMQKISGKKRKGQMERTEPSSNVSEFVSTDSTVHIGQLISALKGEGTHALVKNKLKRVSKKDKILDIPLPRHEQDKIKRKVAFDDTKTEVSVWEPIVQKNRIAEQMHFPLLKPNLKQYNDPKNVVKRYTPRTSLELEVENLLRASQTEGLNEDKMLTADEEKALRAMSLEEAKERRDLLRKHRALLSYKEAKARYQKRIKSKKYHRIMKKEKQKKDEKELEHLQKTDPEAFLEKLDSVDKGRIQERMSLKHRGASKFMQKQTRFSKFDDEARQSVQDMLQKSRQLTQKENVDSDSDEGEMSVEVVEEEAKVPESKSNPWMKSSVKKQVTYTKPVAVSKKVEEIEEKMSEEEEEEEEEDEEEDEEMEETEEEDEEEVDEESEEEEEDLDEMFDAADAKLKKGKPTSRKVESKKVVKKVKEESSEEEEEEKEEDAAALSESLKRKQKYEDFDGDWSKAKERKSEIKSETEDSKEHEEEVTVDPGKFMTLDGSLRGSAAPAVTEDADQLEEQRLTIAQAFASDDVMEEFQQEKNEIAEQEKPKDIDLSLPGWGSWGGENIKPKKQKKFLIKAPAAPTRKDSSLSNVIINESKVQSIAKHQVNRLPPNYKNVPTFESSIRHPLGKTWNPETSYQNLVAPKVVTHLGQVIDPISKDATFRGKNKKMDLEGERKRTKQNSGPNKRRKKVY